MFVSTTRTAIAALHHAGLTMPEIARELRLAPTTVSYHVERIRSSSNVGPAAQAAPPPAVAQSSTRYEVGRMLDEGVPRAQIARRLGVSKATVSYHARRLGKVIDDR